MRIETRNNGISDHTVLIPEDGMVLRRKSDGMTFEGELWLGYTYYINGVRLEEPILEKPEHYEEIPAPIEEMTEEIHEEESEDILNN